MLLLNQLSSAACFNGETNPQRKTNEVIADNVVW